MEAYGNGGLQLIVLVNPSQHQFHGDSAAQAKARESMRSLFDKYPTLLPGYRVHSSVLKKNVDNFLKAYDGRGVALLYSSPSLSDTEFKKVALNAATKYQVALNQSVTSTQISMIPGHQLIDTRDHFNKLVRNADYNGSELFTDRKAGKGVAGVGDYTIVGRALELGGGKPGAVAIHASFRKPAGDVWVEHFVSDDVDRDVGDVASKFLQATKKLMGAISKRPGQFGSDAAIARYEEHLASSTFPGLGKNKQYQIQHHIRLMLESV